MIRRPRVILALLTGLNFLNYLDRLVVSAVLPSIQRDLGLSSFVSGTLATVFLLGYFLTSPFFGALGDRGRRTWLIAGGVLVWSAATFASGLATSTAGLIAARAFVGVGEASYATLAPTLIDDLAPPARRGRWLAIFYAAIPVGSACGYLAGGILERYWGWRYAFFVAGGPGVALAALCLLIDEPARKAVAERAKILGSIAKLWASRLYVRGVLGYAAFTFALGGFSFWAPSYLFHRYDMPLLKANTVFGGITVVTGFAGTALGGWLADRAARLPADTNERTRDHWAVLGYLRMSGIAMLVATPFAAASLMAPTATLFFIAAFFCQLALFVTTSPINGVILRAVPSHLRASAMAFSIFTIHLLGDMWSPPLIGALQGVVSLPWAMSVVPLAIAVSTALWWTRRGAVAQDPIEIPAKKSGDVVASRR